MSRFRLTELAEADLEKIVDHIVDDAGAARADTVLGEIVAAIHTLAEQPGIGHPRPDLSDDPLLFWPVHRFLIAYRPDTAPLQVVRIVHGSRGLADLRRELNE